MVVLPCPRGERERWSCCLAHEGRGKRWSCCLAHEGRGKRWLCCLSHEGRGKRWSCCLAHEGRGKRWSCCLAHEGRGECSLGCLAHEGAGKRSLGRLAHKGRRDLVLCYLCRQGRGFQFLSCLAAHSLLLVIPIGSSTYLRSPITAALPAREGDLAPPAPSGRGEGASVVPLSSPAAAKLTDSRGGCNTAAIACGERIL